LQKILIFKILFWHFLGTKVCVGRAGLILQKINPLVGSQELQNLLQKLLLLMWQTTIDGNIIATSDAIY
jgi:hypothetical protein